jgi:hypothetical protein
MLISPGLPGRIEKAMLFTFVHPGHIEMSNAKTKAGRRSEGRAVPDDVRQLLELIFGEIEAPVDLQELLVKLPSTENCTPHLGDFLKAKDRAQRREAYIKTETLWFRKYGWFMARIVMLFALLVIVYTVLTRNAGVDFVSSVVLGAALYYGLLVTLSNWRYRDTNKKRLALLGQEGRKYQRDVVGVAAALMKQFKLDAYRYPISNPKSDAGLESRDGKYFIPLPSE